MALFDFLNQKEESKNSDILTPKICSTNIPSEITKKIENINWVDYETAYGNAEKTIPFYLKNLFCSDAEIALDATHQLWCSLCHQHAYISTASLPAYDILKIALLELDNKMKIEILDIFQGFAICTNNEYLNSLKVKPEKWQLDIRQKLNTDIKIFEELRNNSDELIADFSNFIYENLKNENN
jgi:hypothetical protein